MNILLTAILFANLCIFVAILFAFFKISGVYRQFQTFINPPDDKTPSPLAQLIEAMSIVAGRAIVAQIKTTFMGKQSADARREGIIDEAIAGDVIGSANPLIGSILQAFPSVGKAIRKNPALLDFAISKLGGKSAVGSSIGGSNGNSQAQTKFSL